MHISKRTLIEAITRLIIALTFVSFAEPLFARSRPNIIWIMADDLGYGDLGCYGCKDIPTPHIDSIASNGIKCTNFYAAASSCTPSRASILSGRYPEAVGMTKVLMGKGGMSSSVVTLPEVLKSSGYATGLIGKWHLGYTGTSLPNNQGFDDFYGHRGGKIDFFNHKDDAQKERGNPMGKHDFFENEHEIFPQGYSTELFTKRAIGFLEQHKDQPFFLFLAYNAPHYARKGVLQAPEPYVRKFAKDKNKPTMRELYAAMVSCMDDGVGEVLACLKRNEMEKNTIVIFVSDNGADPEHGGSNTPLSGGKKSTREGGLRVPMLAQWPGHLVSGTTSKEILHMIDFFPTMLSVAGAEKPQGLKLDGCDALECLKGVSKIPERALLFGSQTVRMGKWKLSDSKLYDLDEDPQETRDLSAEQPDVFTKLNALIDR
ncbi:MAG: hypothetical protein RLZ22_853 [Verrucomicrobiota bacterium]|jgi:arylsulfatase A-like enzyme